MPETSKSLLTQDEFIALFPSTRFRYLHDVTKEVVQGNDHLDLSWNDKGYGVSYTVNGFPPTGPAKQPQLLSLNANYVDVDVDPKLSQEEKTQLIQQILMSGMDAGVLPPTIINRTQKGSHFIWLYPETLAPTPDNIAKWRETQKWLVKCFKGDTNAMDPSRVLRLPFTWHLKDPENPFWVNITSYSPEARYTLSELDASVPKYPDQEVEPDKKSALELLLSGVPVGEGLRHKALAQIAGLLLNRADTPEKQATARLNYYDWDRKIVGSPERFEDRRKELDDIFDGILKREISDNEVVNIDKLRLWTIGEILAQDFGEEEWLVESLIPKQGMTVLSGSPGDFKTWITIHTALCVARGLPVFNKFPTMPGGVLIIDEEDHIRLLKKRLSFLGAKDDDNIFYVSQGGIKVDDKATRDWLVKIITEKNIKLLILDSLVRVHQQDENDAKGMAKVFCGLQDAIKAGASILFTHHHRKAQARAGQNNNPGQNMRGSSDILAAVDCHIVVEKNRDEEDKLAIKQPKCRQGEELKPFEVRVLKEAFDDKGRACPSGFEYAGGYDEKKKKGEEVAIELLNILAEEGVRSRPDIIEDLREDYGRDVIDQGLKLAEEKGDIERVPKEELQNDQRRKIHYRIPGPIVYPLIKTEDGVPYLGQPEELVEPAEE